MVLGDYHQIWFLRCSSDGPNHRITEYSVIRVTQITEFGDSVFFCFVPIIRKIGKLRSKLNSVNPRPCQSVC
jgi:hypothetical protein